MRRILVKGASWWISRTSPVTVLQSLVDALKSDNVELPVKGPTEIVMLSVGLKSNTDSTRERPNVDVMSWGVATLVGDSSTVIVSTVSLLSLSVESSVVAAICTMLANWLVVALVLGVLTNVPLEPALENWNRTERGKGLAVVAGEKVHLVGLDWVGVLLRTFMFTPSPDPWSVQTALEPPMVAGGPVMVALWVNEAWDWAVTNAEDPAGNVPTLYGLLTATCLADTSYIRNFIS
jgi:hypothetical protein